MPRELETLPVLTEDLIADFHFHQMPNRKKDLRWLVFESLSKGINCLALTDHQDRDYYNPMTSISQLNTLPSDWRFYKDKKLIYVEGKTPYSTNDRGMYLIRGYESETKDGHLLFVGTEPEFTLSPRYSASSTLKTAKEIDPNIISIAPHPMAPIMGLRKALNNPDVRDNLDALEYNAHLLIFNDKALAFARMYYLPVLANSDAHHSTSHFGECHNTFESKGLEGETGEIFISSLKEKIGHKHFIASKAEIPLFPKIGLTAKAIYHILVKVE